MRCQQGQATIDYVVLIAVVAVLVAVGVAVASGRAPGIANAVVGQIRHALCIVSGRACTIQRARPCTVQSTRESHRIAANVVLVRISADRYLLRERLSDGTFRLTVAQRGGLGAEAGLGGRAQLTFRGRRVGLTNEARAAGDQAFTYGEVFVATSRAEADRIQARISGGLGRSGDLEPREVFVEAAARGIGRIGIGGSIAGAQLDAFRDHVTGARRDRRSGQTTISFSSGSSAMGLLTLALGGPAGAAEGQLGFALTLDRDGKPIELSMTGNGMLAGGATPPPGLARALGIGTDGVIEVGGRRWELVARMDLTDPVVAAAWAAFRRAPASGDAIRALGESMRTRAILDVRGYSTNSAVDGAAVGFGAGVRFGGEYDHTTDRWNLVSASTRPPGGLWEPRTDCVAA